MGFDSRLKAGAIESPRGDRKNCPLGLAYGRREVMTIESKVHEHGGMADSLVAIDERMVLDEGKAERSSFGGVARMEIQPAESLPRLRDGRLKRGEISKNRLLAALFHDEAVEKQHLSQAEASH